MDHVLASLKEWKEAREAFWLVPTVATDKRFLPEIWTRLGHAEHRLMEIARARCDVKESADLLKEPGI